MAREIFSQMTTRRRHTNTRTRASRAIKRAGDEAELEGLEKGVAELVNLPPPRTFAKVPLSARTRQGLKRAGFVDLTDIQSHALPLALAGRDILGAARTGSGKTLAFLIPILEHLYRRRWSASDGLGAVVISPTRELAIQIFEVLRRIGGAHTFSAGLVIGGKDLKHEQDRLGRMNILVATPGRLLQHLDQTAGFDCASLQLLVLDEADRILDMGFANTLAAIVEHLPRSRQTLLFSATQTRRITDLARLSLHEPADVSVHTDDARMPANLEQYYMVVPLEKKLDTLFSFLRTHTKHKILVFFSSCRQVQFVHDVFCRLRPGLSLMALHGKQKQLRRLRIFDEYTRAKHAALFATDIAARGLDFPAVDWVIQVDAPDSADTYIHRVGRTARYNAHGSALLFVLPSEEKGVLASLNNKSVSLDEIRPRESKVHSIQNQLQSFAFHDTALKHLAQRAFVSYVRSIHLHRDKNTFDVAALPLADFAAALGLPGAPKIKLLRDIKQRQTNRNQGTQDESKSDSGSGDDEDDDGIADHAAPAVRTKHDRLTGRQNQTVFSEHYQRMLDDTFDASSDDELLTLRRADHDLDETPPVRETHISKRKLMQGRSKKAMAATGARGSGDRIVFDDEGNARALYELQNEKEFQNVGDPAEQVKRWREAEAAQLAAADVEDKSRVREKRKEKKRKMKERMREAEEDEAMHSYDSGEDPANGLASLVIPGEESGRESDDSPHRESGEESEDVDDVRPGKRRKSAHSLTEQEALAMRLLS